MVTPELAVELRRVLECFAGHAGFSPRHAVSVEFRPGVVGHHKTGRAADIYGIATAGLDEWKRRWDDAHRRAGASANACVHDAVLFTERQRNLGWRLYKALQNYGCWSRPCGYPIQLFGPWTRTEGPWKSISDRLLWAHRDHIHVAK